MKMFYYSITYRVVKGVFPQCKTSSDNAGVIRYGEEVGVKGVGVRGQWKRG